MPYLLNIGEALQVNRQPSRLQSIISQMSIPLDIPGRGLGLRPQLLCHRRRAIGTGRERRKSSRVYDRSAFQVKGRKTRALSSEKDTISRVEEILMNYPIRAERHACRFSIHEDLSNNAGSYAERAQVYLTQICWLIP